MKTILLLTVLVLAGCSGVYMNRSFVDEMEREDAMWIPGEDFRVTPGDTGMAHRSRSEIMERTPMNRHEKEQFDRERSIKRELQAKEMAMSPQEYQEYSQYGEHFKTPSEKIYFLNLTPSERDEYLESRRIAPIVSSKGRVPASIPSDSDIASYYRPTQRNLPELYIGMQKRDVLEKWGRPSRIDVAGDPRYENERWAFYENGKIKNVYFESGKVQGWELD